MINNLLDSQINLNRLIWIMDDETYSKLFDITKRHLRLANEAFDSTPERKIEILEEIERLRQQRNSMLTNYKKTQ